MTFKLYFSSNGELSTAAYNAQNLSFQQGMTTEADMLSAHKGVLFAQASLLSLDNTIDSLRQSLYLMTGFSSDSAKAIGTVPDWNAGKYYLQAQKAFLHAESGKQSAYNTLYQAWDTYKWAEEGIIMNSSQA